MNLEHIIFLDEERNESEFVELFNELPFVLKFENNISIWHEMNFTLKMISKAPASDPLMAHSEYRQVITDAHAQRSCGRCRKNQNKKLKISEFSGLWTSVFH